MAEIVDGIAVELKAYEDATQSVIARGFALHAAAMTPQDGATVRDVMRLADLYAGYILTGDIPGA